MLRLVGASGAAAAGTALLSRLKLSQPTRAHAQASPGARAEPTRTATFSYTERRTLARSFSGAHIYALRLSEAEEEQLLRVLVSHQAGLINPERSMNPPPESQDETEIAAAIGAERAAQLMKWRHYSPACGLVGRLRETLEEAGAALSEAQVQQFKERILSDPAMEETRGYDRSPAWHEKRGAWWKDARRRFLALGERILTPFQLRVLQEEKELVQVFGTGRPSWDESASDESLPKRAQRIPLSSEVSDANKRAFGRRHLGSEAAELGLSERELDELLTTLGTQLWRSFFQEEPSKTEEENFSEVVAVIGTDRAAEFNVLRASRSARLHLKFLRRELRQHGAPLSATQYRELISLMKQGRFLNEDHSEDLVLARANSGFMSETNAVLSTKQLRVLDENSALNAAMLR
jgi:hypothetical protein